MNIFKIIQPYDYFNILLLSTKCHMHNISYKSKQQIMQLTATAFNMADQDHNNAMTIN